jgi:1-hydroxy-2-naphthoate dioxygenase
MNDVSNAALPYTYKWRDTLRVLTTSPQPASAIGTTGDARIRASDDRRSTMPTIGCWVQMIPPGESTEPHRHTSSTIYHVVQGSGATTVGQKKSDGKQLAWGAHDCFFVPSWNWHHFENKSKKNPAILFSVTDRPVLESLCLFREEAA